MNVSPPEAGIGFIGSAPEEAQANTRYDKARCRELARHAFARKLRCSWPPGCWSS